MPVIKKIYLNWLHTSDDLAKIKAKNKNTVNIPANTDKAHVHDAGWTREDITGHVDVAPHHAQRPVPYRKKI